MKKSQYVWQKEAENFFGWTPHPKLWFEFLGWVTALSTLDYLSQKTDSIYIKIMYGASYLVLYNYIEKNIWKRRFQDYIPFKFPKLVKKIITYLITLVIVFMLHILVGKLVEEIINELRL